VSQNAKAVPLMESLSKRASAELIASSNDICLVIDDEGIIRDVAVNSNDSDLKLAEQWVGKAWRDTVTVESRPKIDDLMQPGDTSNGRWRQVNHPGAEDLDLPVMYKSVALGGDDGVLAVGREMRQISQLQQRLLDVQHSLESDYARIHQAEVRYRMLFSMSSESILCVDADSRRILEANPAAAELLGGPVNKLINRTFPRGFSDTSHDKINALLMRVRAAGVAEEVLVTTARDGRSLRLSASLVRKDEGPYFLLRIAPAEQGDNSTGISHRVIDVINRSPDSFVVTSADGVILATNAAFMELVGVATDLQIVNQPLDRWLGRRPTDVSLLLRNLPDRGEIRQFESVVRPEFGEPVDVELSAVSALDGDNPCLGFIIRQHRIGHTDKKTSASKQVQELPRTLKEITELVGRVPLKELVRETTDIIERMCIEAALKASNDSRASAAEMLGLSRQSLYVKLRRYGIGENNGDDSE